MKKKLLSLLLAIVMVIGLIPAMVIGVGAEGEPVLPEGCEEIDYYTLSPRKYLNTKYVFAEGGCKVTVDADFTEPNATFVMGSRKGYNENMCFVMYDARMYSASTNMYYTNPIILEGHHTYEMSYADQVLSVNRDDSFVASKTFEGTYVNSRSFAFGRLTDTDSNRTEAIKLYGLKLYQGDTLVREYIPCKFGNEEGLYETVTKSFSFEISQAAELAEVSVPDLPGTLTQIPSVYFHSGAILDTGFSFGSNDAEIYLAHGSSLESLSFGAYGQNSGNAHSFLSYQGSHIFIGATSFSYDNNNRILKATVQGTTATVGSNKKTGIREPFYALTSPTIALGIANNLPSWEKKNAIPYEGEVYAFRISEGGELKRDFIPCRADDGKVGFYDTVTESFYESTSDVPFDALNSACEATYTDDSISISSKDGKLVLPATANYSDMTGKLILPEGAVLTGTETSKELTVGEDELDLTVLFGSMAVGTVYTLNVNVNNELSTLRMIQQDDAADLYITLNNHDLAWLNAAKTNSASGSLLMIDGADTVAAQVKKIKGRGNTSWSDAQKKGYNLTLEIQEELIEGVNGKKYCLIGFGDRGKDALNAMTGFTLYQQLLGEDSCAVSWRVVNLYINGEALGFYLLTEKVMIDDEVVDVNKAEMTDGTEKRTVSATSANITDDERALLDIGIKEFKYSPDTLVTSDGGYIIEGGYYYSNEVSGFITSRGNKWVIKEPEYCSLEQISRIASYMQSLEDALFSETGFNADGVHYSELLDLNSLAKWYLVKGFCGDYDAFETSCFLCINGNNDSLSGKMFAGPVWDLNNGAWTSTKIIDAANYSGGAFQFYTKLTSKGDFVAELNSVYANDFSTLIQAMAIEDVNTVDTFNYYLDGFSSTRKADDFIWGGQVYMEGKIVGLPRFKGAVNGWPSLWSDETNALRGVTAANVSGTLTATAVGATGYQWYKLNDDFTGTAVDSETNATFTPAEDGTYYVVATGTALAGTTATSMTSNPVEFTAPSLFNDASISLKDNTWLNFYTFLTDENVEDYTYTYVIDGVETEIDTEEMLKKMSASNELGYEYRLSVALKPYQLAEDVTVNMYDLDGNLVCSKTDSVRAYSGRRLEASSNENYKAALRALLEYGAAVQVYQNYKTDNLANSILH